MATKLTVLLAQDDAERFEAYCHETGHKKSTLIARLVREYLDAQESLPADPDSAEGNLRRARSGSAGKRARG